MNYSFFIAAVCGSLITNIVWIISTLVQLKRSITQTDYDDKDCFHAYAVFATILIVIILLEILLFLSI